MKPVQSSAIIISANAEEPGYKGILAESEKFDHWDIHSLTEIIIKHYHVDTRKNIAVIYDLAQKVSGKHSRSHPELAQLEVSLFLFFDDLLFQLKKEEQVLFPDVIQMCEKKYPAGPEALAILGKIKKEALMMQNEHRAALKELNDWRRLTGNYLIPKDACKYYKYLFEKMKSFETELMLHIYLENNILFPKVIQMGDHLAGPYKMETGMI